MVRLSLWRRKEFFMLKIVVFDSGYGGELLADYLEAELPVMEVIRIIDWKNANMYQKNVKRMRQYTDRAIRPYIGKVNLIIFANYYLATTSLKYFQRKYKNQQFIGLELHHPCNFRYQTHILTTKSLAKTLSYKFFVHKIKGKTVILDDWPILIDDGELGHAKIRRDLSSVRKCKASQIILACSQFVELEDEFRRVLGHNLKIINNFDEVLRSTYRVLRIRGGASK